MTFREFVSLVNPRFVWYRHAEIIADVLQRVADGDLKRVIISMPPRHGKSEMVSRLFPAYYLYRYPRRWVGLACYGAELAYAMARNARDNYTLAGLSLAQDASAVKKWETRKGGGMWAAGVGGRMTGLGFHLGLIDDPIKNAEEAQSARKRNKQKDWLASTFSTREEPGGAIVVTQTRWHNDDLTGHLLEMEKDEPEHWHVVRFEAIKEETINDLPASCTLEPDFREVGEALCPERYPLAKLEKIKKRIGQFWGSLFQQRPQPLGGAIFQKDWFAERYDVTATAGRVIGRWLMADTAFKAEDDSDYSALCVWELWDDYSMAVRYMWQEQILSAFLPDKIIEFAKEWNADGLLRGIVIEDKGSGITTIQTLRLSAPAWIANMVLEFMPKGTKEYRARLSSVWCSRGRIHLPAPAQDNAGWYKDFLDPINGQLWLFPYAANDDLLDTFTMGILYGENLLAEGSSNN